MKRNILTIVLTAILMTVVFMVFAQNEKTAESDVLEDLPKFNHAMIDSSGDFKHFRSEAELEIAKNRKTIVELKGRKSTGTKIERADYRDQVSKLEESNDQMAIKINTSEMIQTKNWTSFKRDFNHEMAELKNSIQDTAKGRLNP